MPTFADSSCASGKDCGGTISGNATFVPGLDNGNAISFDGASEVVFPLALTENILDRESRTICLWAKFDTAQAGGLFSYGTAGPDRADFSLRALGANQDPDEKLRIQLWGVSDKDLDIDADANTWHHYCMSYKFGTDVKLYFDGSLSSGGFASPDGPLVTGQRNFRLGNWFDGANNFLTGLEIDDLCVYESALTQPQVKELRDLRASAAPSTSPTNQPSSS